MPIHTTCPVKVDRERERERERERGRERETRDTLQVMLGTLISKQ